MIKSGDIGVARSKSNLSETIMKATKGEWSHTFQCIYINGIMCVFDAQIEGCYPMEFENWCKKFDYDYQIFRRPYEFSVADFSLKCVNFFGVSYDVKGLAVGLFKSFTLKFWKKKDMKEKYRNNGKTWCSELTARVLDIENPEDYSPQNIYEYLIKNKWQRIK